MNRAFSACVGFCAHEPRALPWAGMNLPLWGFWLESRLASQARHWLVTPQETFASQIVVLVSYNVFKSLLDRRWLSRYPQAAWMRGKLWWR